MQTKSCIIICRCPAELVPEGTIDDIVKGVGAVEADVIELNDLCAISLNEKYLLEDIAARYTRKIVVACYPRAVRSILKQGGIDFGYFHVLNFRELSAGDIVSSLEKDHNIPAGKPDYHVHKTNLEVPAWYPVVDTSLCSLCGKCANYCLFGVYKFDKKSLKVVSPLSCKNNCPACGRLCPESAIIFPRYPQNSVLSGTEPGKDAKPDGKENMVEQLNKRNLGRKSIFRTDFTGKVEEERQKAINDSKNGRENKK